MAISRDWRLGWSPGGSTSTSGGTASSKPPSISLKPGYYPLFNRPRKKTLDKQSKVTEKQQRLDVYGGVLPILYGRGQVGSQDPFAIDYDSVTRTWTVGYALCLGEVGSLQELWVDGVNRFADSGTLYNFYAGTTTQTADPWLSAAITGYTDTMVLTTPNGNIGICYIVLQYDEDEYDGWPEVICTIRGKKVYSYNSATTAFSFNFGLHLADFLSNDIYGLGMTVNTTSAQAVETYCDELVDGEERYHGYLLMDRQMDGLEWVEIMRMYASCFVSFWDGEARLIPDKDLDLAGAGSPDHVVTEDDIVRGSLRIEEIDSANTPTVVRATYTDTQNLDIWREREADPAEDAGVAAGTVEFRESTLNLTGFSDHKRAHRESVRWLNKTNGLRFVATWRQFEEAYKYEMGDVVQMSPKWLIYMFSWATSVMYWRITNRPYRDNTGQWVVEAILHDDAIYSDVAQTVSDSDDPILPTRGAPEAPTSILGSETVYQLKDQTWEARMDVTWSPPANSHVTSYEVLIKDDTSGNIIWQGSVGAHLNQISSGPLPHPADYDVEVYAYNVNLIGAAGFAANNPVTLDGHSDNPDPPSAFGVAQRNVVTHGSWDVSPTDDVTGYLMRWYDQVGESWVDGVSTERFYDTDYFTIVGEVPAGDYKFEIRAVNSIGNESTGVTVNLTVEGTSVKATNFSAVANAPNPYPIDTESGPTEVEMLLPSSPALGDEVRFFDASGSFDVYNFIIKRNGELILEETDDLTVDVRYFSGALRFVGGTIGWALR